MIAGVIRRAVVLGAALSLAGAEARAAEPRYFASSEGGVLIAELDAVVPYPAEELWRPLSATGAQHAWVPYMRTASLERLDGEVAVCDGLTNLPWPLKDRTWTVRMRTEVEDGGERYVASWEYVPGSGNIDDTYGAWSLQALEDGRTRVKLRAFADVGVSVPGPMLRWAENKALPEMLEALIRQADVQ